jgi:iron complex transport system substrate-binding protein
MILEKLKVKKILIPIMIVIFSLSMLFLGTGCKIDKAAEETIEETTEDISEKVQTEEEKEEAEKVTEEEFGVEYPVTIYDDLGQQEGKESREIVLEKPVEKVILGEKCAALTLLELEVADKAVGGADFIAGYKVDWSTGEATDDPNIPGYEDIPIVGGYSGINVEEIIELSPDIFINLFGHSDQSDEQLEAAGIKIYTVGTIKDLDHIKSHVKNYGLMFDKLGAANKIITDMNEKETLVKMRVASLATPEDKKPTVFMFGPLGDMETLQTWAPAGDTIVEDLIVKAGGKCLTADQGLEGWPEYSIEELLESDPDVIILPFGEGVFESIEQFTSLGLVQELGAVKNGRVYGIDKDIVWDLSSKNADALILFAEFINNMKINGVVAEDGSVNYPITIYDNKGQYEGEENRALTFDTPVNSAVIGEKNFAKLIVELGLEDLAVAGTDYMVGYKPDYANGGFTDEPNVAGLEDVEQIGAYQGVNVEKIIELDPDIFVILMGHGDINNDQLEAAGIKCFTEGTIGDLGSIKGLLYNYGLIFNKVPEVMEIINKMNVKEAVVKEAINALNLTDEEKPGVFMLGMASDKDTISCWVPGAETIVDDLIIKAGGINVVSEQGLSGWAEYSSEALLAADPDIIILPIGNTAYQYESVEEFTSNPLVKSLAAVKDGKVYGIDGQTITDLSWEEADALIQFAEWLHGIEINLN